MPVTKALTHRVRVLRHVAEQNLARVLPPLLWALDRAQFGARHTRWFGASNPEGLLAAVLAMLLAWLVAIAA